MNIKELILKAKKHITLILLLLLAYASDAISANGKIFTDKLNRFKVETEQDWVIVKPATKTMAFVAGLPRQGIELLIDIQRLNPKPHSSKQFVDKYINDGDVEKSFAISNNNNIKLLNYKKTTFNNIPAVNITQKQIYPNGVNTQEYYVNTFLFSVKDSLYTVGFRANVSTYNINELSKESEKIMKTIQVTQ